VDEVERQISCFGCKAAKNVSGCDFMSLLLRRCEHYGKRAIEMDLVLRGLYDAKTDESCPSQSTNSAFTTTEKGKGFR